MFSIESFKGVFGSGARPTLFHCDVFSPLFAGQANKFRFSCKGASMPQSQGSSVAIKVQGRDVKVWGDRTFPTWSVTVLNDDDQLVRTGFLNWMASMNTHATNLMITPGGPNPASYKASASITAMDKAGKVTAAYQFIGLFPVSVGQVQKGWDSTDQIEEFTVDFDFDYWQPVPVPTNPATAGMVIA